MSIFTKNALTYSSFILCACIVSLLLFTLYPRDGSVFNVTLMTSSMAALLLIAFVPVSKLEEWIKTPSERDTPIPNQAIWFLLGLVTMLIALAILENSQPYYFTQDDVHSQLLPVALPAMRSFFAEGIFPTWNGYQLMGVPTTSLSYHPLAYPPLYVAYAIAEFLIGNAFLTFEVYAWMHFLVGYYFAFKALRVLQLRPCISASASLCFVLLGFNLITGRSWPFVIPTVAWLPAFCYSLALFSKKSPSWRWVGGTAAIIALDFISNVQMGFYGAMFWGAGIVWMLVCRTESLKQDAVKAVIAALIGMAVYMPLLVVQTIEVGNMVRPRPGYNISQGLNNLILPWPIVTSPHPRDETQHPGVYYFSGGVFIIGFFLQCALALAYLAKASFKRHTYTLLCFPLFGSVALILAIGSSLYLWDILALVPPFSKFRSPVKFLPFATFFMLISGALLAETAARKLRYGSQIAIAVSLLAGGVSFFNAIHCTSAHFIWKDKPYPALPSAYKKLQAEGFSTNGRIHPFVTFRSDEAGYSLSLGLNYPSLYSIPVTTSYYGGGAIEDGLVESQNAIALFNENPAYFFNEYGVDKVTIIWLSRQDRPVHRAKFNTFRQMISYREILGKLSVFNIASANTKPIAYAADNPSHALPYRIRTNGVDIDISGLNPTSPHTITANFLHRPWFSASTDTGESLSVNNDTLNRITVSLPHAANILSIRYTPPWYYGGLAGFALLLIAGTLGYYSRKK